MSSQTLHITPCFLLPATSSLHITRQLLFLRLFKAMSSLAQHARLDPHMQEPRLQEARLLRAAHWVQQTPLLACIPGQLKASCTRMQP